MPLSKTSPEAIDLDNLWQQLRNGACLSTPEKSNDSLSERPATFGQAPPGRCFVGCRNQTASAATVRPRFRRRQASPEISVQAIDLDDLEQKLCDWSARHPEQPRGHGGHGR
jgi:hypothetical protein